MNKIKATKRIGVMEAQLALLKRFFFGAPNATTDAENWQRVKKDVKRSRKTIYRQRYGKTQGVS